MMHVLLSACIRIEERLTIIAMYPFQEVIWGVGRTNPEKKQIIKIRNE